MNTDLAAAAEAGLNSLSLDDAGVNERPLSDAAFEAPKVEEQTEAKESAKPTTREALEKALDQVEAKDKETAEKAEKAVSDAKAKADEAKEAEKADKTRDETGKFAKADKVEANKGASEKTAAERSAPEDNRQSEGRKYAEPPARFLPEARTKWANVPNEVKAEFHRVSQEFETEIEQSKAARERYEPIRQFDEMARQNGRELKDSLAKVVQIEQHIARDPIGALDTILREIGPRKADGSPVSLYEVAQVVVQQGPQAARQRVAPANQAQQMPPQVQELATKVQELEAQLKTAPIVPVIERFAAQHEDYQTLEPQIAAILKSGVIDQIYGTGLSPEQKLAEAYRMAGGSSPSRSAPEPVQQHSEPKNEPSEDAGLKSIRGAPTGGADPAKKRFKSNRDAATAALAELGI